MRARFLLLVALAAGLGAGCRRPSREGLGAAAAADEAIDPARLGEPRVLIAALAQAGARLDQALGPRHAEAAASLTASLTGRPEDKLEESWQLDTDGKGGLHLLHDNSRGEGWEAVLTGEDLYVRPRHARFVKRRPEPGEIERLRGGVEGVLADYLELLRPSLTVSASGSGEAAGRKGRRWKLGAKREPDRTRPEARPERKWRETLEVRYLDGEVLLAEPSGALLAARLEARYTFQREGKGSVDNTLSYRFSIGPARAVEAPADFVAVTGRPRPMLDRQQLLGSGERP
jgi:hypothetical protein